MKALGIDKQLIQGYMALLHNLKPGSKRDLIALLTQSLKSDIQRSDNTFDKAFGAFHSQDSADKMIKDIRDSRSFGRQIDSL